MLKRAMNPANTAFTHFNALPLPSANKHRMAQAGGKDPSGIDAALAKAAEVLGSQIR